MMSSGPVEISSWCGLSGGGRKAKTAATGGTEHGASGSSEASGRTRKRADQRRQTITALKDKLLSQKEVVASIEALTVMVGELAD